jgi:hypothetical protein
VSVDGIMASFPYYPSSFRNHSTHTPFPYESPIRNSPGGHSEPSQRSSISADNEPDGDTSSGVLSSVNVRNEDLPASTTTQFSLSPYVRVRDPSIPVRDGFQPTSFTDFSAPLSLRSNDFRSSHHFLPAFSLAEISLILQLVVVL